MSFFFSLLPINFSLLLARSVGTVSYYLFPKKAKLAYLNLKLAFENRFDLKERKRIVKELFRNLFMNLMEFLYFPSINRKYIDKYIKIIGEEKIKEVLGRGKGLIFLTAHFGNWELLSLVAQFKEYPIVVLARQQKPARLNLLLNQYRSKGGAKVVMRGSGIQSLIRPLKENKILGILGDQKSGKSGRLVELFSRLVWTPVGAVKLSRYTGAGILPVFIIRENGPYHRIEIGDELSIDKGEEISLRKFHLLLEKYIERYPNQWLWFHRRWKGSPNRDILILSDGKPGHLNQAKALAKIVKEVIEEKFKDLHINGEIVKIREIEVKFKNLFTRFLINLLGIFARENCRGCLKCLKLCLDRDTYGKISSFYGDIIISCGVNLSAVNLFTAKENQAKSFIVLRTGLIPLKRFDLAVIPLHDRPKKIKNVVVTQTALNLIDREEMEEGMKRIEEEGFKIRKDKFKIGVLIGGETRDYIITKEIIERLVEELVSIAKEIDAELLFTTSRRTPKEIETFLKDKLLKNPFCPLLVIANEKNIEKAVPGILGLSDIVIVSGESVSMVSEAVSSNKPVLVFKIEEKKIKKKKKFKYFLENLNSLGYINLVKPEDVSKEIRKLLNKPSRKAIFERDSLLYEKIKNIIS